ncbi:MAG: hypothetical protein JXA10_13905, partial [Anaerolineae bacterium]|nr:hypothetical protein [Anaerolineae bacterium]
KDRKAKVKTHPLLAPMFPHGLLGWAIFAPCAIENSRLVFSMVAMVMGGVLLTRAALRLSLVY